MSWRILPIIQQVRQSSHVLHEICPISCKSRTLILAAGYNNLARLIQRGIGMMHAKPFSVRISDLDPQGPYGRSGGTTTTDLFFQLDQRVD